MSSHRTFTRNFIVLFILNLSFLMVGCGGGDSDGTVETADGIADTIDSTVTIDASVTEGGAPLEVRFSVDSDDLVLSQSWNFGDGAIAQSINPNSSVEHTYLEDGTYTVSVVTNTNLGGPRTDTILITVGTGISLFGSTVFLINNTSDLTLYSIVGNSSVGDIDFNFRLQETDPDDDTPGVIEPGEQGFIELTCDVSWELDAFFTDGVDLDAWEVHQGMTFIACGEDYTWRFFDI